ncbi:MAG: YdcF family protein [Planctomycetaceae bacterium]|nr:YdcF family protein [Planctomycetaceae bacterium]
MKHSAASLRYTSQGYGPPNAPGWIGVSRGAALGVAWITVFNLVEIFAFNTSAIHNWLCNFRMLTQPLCISVLSMLATALFIYAVKPGLPGSVWLATTCLIAVVTLFTGWDLWEVNQNSPENLRQTAMSRSLGVLMLLAVAGLGILIGDSKAIHAGSSLVTVGISCILTIFGFVVVTLQSGSIGDLLPADAVPVILVPGCDMDPEVDPSEALHDRVTTASQLFKDGHAELLVLSGSSGDEDATGTAALKLMAVEAGVPEQAIVLDNSSVDTAQALQFANRLPELENDHRLIVVSHWFELARMRMLGRQAGIQIFAVPAEQKHALSDQQRLYAQEVLAFLRTCVHPAKKLLSQP